MNVSLALQPEEPAFGPWHSLSVSNLTTKLFPGDLLIKRRNILAVDGRSGSGKTTLAAQLADAVPGSVVVHLDDQPNSASWRGPDAQATILSDPVPEGCSYFDWTAALIDNILEPYREGTAVTYRPASWDDWNRGEGAIHVPASTPLLILEGVGAGRLELSHLIDKLVWVQSDFEIARVRGIVRDGEAYRNEAEMVWDKFTAEELPFLVEQTPWARADLIVLGNQDVEEELAPGRIFVAKSENL